MFDNSNVSIATADFYETLKKFPNFWTRTKNQETFALGHKAWWLNVCSVELSEVLTEWGLCYTFNIANANNVLNTEEVAAYFSYKHYIFLHGFTPMGSRTMQCDEKLPTKTSNYQIGLVMELYKKLDLLHSDFEYNSRFKNPFEYFHGIHLIFHHPEELPSTFSVHHYAVGSTSLVFWIKSQMSITDESLMKEPPSVRNCYVKDEKHLKFFKTYNQHNCEQECLANHTLNLCQCVQFFMLSEFMYI